MLPILLQMKASGGALARSKQHSGVSEFLSTDDLKLSALRTTKKEADNGSCRRSNRVAG